MMLEDEFGLSSCEPVATTWAPRGQTEGVGKSTMVGVTLFTSAFWAGRACHDLLVGPPPSPVASLHPGFLPAHRVEQARDYPATRLSLNGGRSTRRNTATGMRNGI